MSIVFFDQLPIDMTNPLNWTDFFNAVASSTHSSTSWSATNAATGGVWEFTGAGFADYQSNVPFTGTITGITYTVNGVTLFSVSGASANVNTFLTYGYTGDWLTAVAGLYPGSETISGTSSDDHLEGFAGNDTLDGGAGNDIVRGGADVDVINGGDGNDTLNGGVGDDIVRGGAGNDTFELDQGGNQLFGEGGNDRFYAAAGNLVDGGDGSDQVFFSAALNSTLSPDAWATATGQTLLDGTVIRNVETFTISGNSLTIAPTFALGAPGYSPLNYVEFYGTLTLDFSASSLAVSMIQVQSAQTSLIIGGDLWLGIRALGYPTAAYRITGSFGSDTLIGGTGQDTINGGDGNDNIRAYNGNDTLSGGDGSDLIWVDLFGNDVIDGGAGVDTVFFATGAVTLNLGVTAQQNIGSVLLRISNVENVIGSYEADTITGAAAANSLNGAGGDDILSGGAGDDDLRGEDGADTLNGDDGDDSLAGGLGADNLNGGAGTDTASYADANSGVGVFMTAMGANTGDAAGDGFASIENLLGSNWTDTLVGNDGANALVGSGGDDTLDGGDGDDTLDGGLGLDTLSGGAGNDSFLYAIGDGNGAIDGGADIDTLNIADGAAGSLLNATWNGAAIAVASGNTLANIEIITADMGGGVDWLIYAASSAAVNVNLAAGSASGFASLVGVERVVGGGGNDTLTGDGADNRLDGGAGNDALSGGGGLDTLIGGDGADALAGGLGNDSIQAGAGNDTIAWVAGDGRDTIDGGADVDTFNVTGAAVAELGRVTWNGSAITALMDNALVSVETVNLNLGSGVDWLIYNASAAVTVDLSTGAASGFASISNIERVIGGSGGDTLTGDGLDNRLDGQGGADTLNGGAGFDTVLGGDGDDVIYASAGNDSLQGQNGADAFYWTAADGRDVFNGGADTDTLYLTGSAVADVADANWNGAAITGLLNNALIDIENINLDLGAGGSGGDWLRYNTSAAISVNLATGTATGFASITGVENLIGGSAGDTLLGDGGVNKINGAAGDDFITGGAGNDSLTGGLGADTFVYAAGAGADTVLDFDAWADGGQDFIDVSALGINATNFAARVTIIDTGADTVVRIDSDIFITLKNVSGDGDNVITQADFILGA